MPVRIQLSRKKGWRMPENTVKVDRSTPWGNPFPVRIGRAEAVQDFRLWIENSRHGQYRAAAAKRDLRGKNLACWCPLDGPCHADVLLEICNLPSPGPR